MLKQIDHHLLGRLNAYNMLNMFKIRELFNIFRLSDAKDLGKVHFSAHRPWPSGGGGD